MLKAKLLRELVEASYDENEFMDQTILAIADRLTRSELKTYTRALIREEKARTILVDIAQKPSAALKEKIKRIFGDKRIEYRDDESLILGVRITDNDIVYHANLHDSLTQALSEITEDYE